MILILTLRKRESDKVWVKRLNSLEWCKSEPSIILFRYPGECMCVCSLSWSWARAAPRWRPLWRIVRICIPYLSVWYMTVPYLLCPPYRPLWQVLKFNLCCRHCIVTSYRWPTRKVRTERYVYTLWRRWFSTPSSCLELHECRYREPSSPGRGFTLFFTGFSTTIRCNMLRYFTMKVPYTVCRWMM